MQEARYCFFFLLQLASGRVCMQTTSRTLCMACATMHNTMSYGPLASSLLPFS